MSPYMNSQTTERVRPTEANDLYMQLRDHLPAAVEALKSQSAADTAARTLLQMIPECVASFERQGDGWLSRVFDISHRSYEQQPLIEHSVNVAILALAIGQMLDFYPGEKVRLMAGALLHDVGMFLLPSATVSSDRPLTHEQRQALKSHPQLGHSLLSDVRLTTKVAQTVLQEQERWDGTGYPYQVQGHGILLHAQIIGLCDSIESLTHPRPYRNVKCFDEGYQQLIGDGISRFSVRLWHAMLRRLTPFPPGTSVILSDGTAARVVRVHPFLPYSPMVVRLDDAESGGEVDAIDLSQRLTLRIERGLPLGEASMAGAPSPTNHGR